MAVSESGPTPSLVLQIVEHLGRQIIRGEVQPGKTLPVEQDICDQFNASRNAVREAVKTLAGKNLVRSARRAGTIVVETKDWNLFDPQVIGWMLSEDPTRETLMNALSELREIIEPEAAALAAERASTTQVLRIFEIFEEMKANSHNPERAIEMDVAFHRAVLEATGNALLQIFAHSFGLLLAANFQLSIQVNNAFIRNLDDHRWIAEAIRDRDPERAREAATGLLKKNKKDIRQMKEEQRRGDDQ
ncbi:MAG: FadR family transcriptional regulator [Alphaproteobacteria bacterium]|nr:FadR family transcriptional regulator [Alphaproteobacteria bacterium]